MGLDPLVAAEGRAKKISAGWHPPPTLMNGPSQGVVPKMGENMQKMRFYPKEAIAKIPVAEYGLAESSLMWTIC